MTTVAAAYRAGKAPQSELIAAQTPCVELRNRATEAAMQGRRARIALARYIGADADRPLGDAPDVARLPFDPARLADIDAQPEIHLARAQESIAATEADIARAAKLPDWSAEVSYAVRGSTYAEHGVADVLDRPALVAGHAPGPRVRGEAEGTRRRARDARGRAADAHRRGARRCVPNGKRRARRRSASATTCCRSRRSGARRRWPPIAAAPARSPRFSTRAAPSSMPSSPSLQQEQAAAKAWAWLNFVFPVTEKS